jgi:hypothetical protein
VRRRGSRARGRRSYKENERPAGASQPLFTAETFAALQVAAEAIDKPLDHVAPSIGHFWRHGNSVMKNRPSTSTAGSVKRSGLPCAHSRNCPTTSFRDGTGSGGQISGVSFSCLVSAMMVWYVPAPNP